MIVGLGTVALIVLSLLALSVIVSLVLVYVTGAVLRAFEWAVERSIGRKA